MNEFEWRRQMRDLRHPHQPQRDLWGAIDAAMSDADAAIAQATRPHTRTTASPGLRWMAVAGVAASILLASGIGWHLARPSLLRDVAGMQSTPSWKPTDPRLAGAAIELDAAHMELQQAIQQAPGSGALQRLLISTERQQSQLRQLAHEAG